MCHYSCPLNLSECLQLIATKGLRDAGAIASARAAEIYGLNILDDNMQAMSYLPSNCDRLVSHDMQF